MLPVATPSEMAAFDAANAHQLDALIERAGAAVAREAVAMLGGTYGRRVTVIAGKGNNGADGRVAARRLQRLGVRVSVVGPDHPGQLAGDLVIDAAYGCGLSRPYGAPQVAPGTGVLAVDIPSGIDGLTGALCGSPLVADRTMTLLAHKPGLLFEPGASFAGQVTVADLGAQPPEVEVGLIVDSDVGELFRRPARTTHKWHAATWIIGGSPGMSGAPCLAAHGAQRAGAGYVRAGSPGSHLAGLPIEAVAGELRESGWHEQVIAEHGKFKSLVIGPGLGRSNEAKDSVRRIVEQTDVNIVLDADALHAIDGLDLRPNVILTPHDGEFEVLTGSRPGPDRIESARSLAASSGATVLLKGPTTVVAAPDGRVRLCASGDQRLATAGTGDVLAGMIGALLAQGMAALGAAAIGAHLHGRAATQAPPMGMVASDIANFIPPVIEQLIEPEVTPPT